MCQQLQEPQLLCDSNYEKQCSIKVELLEQKKNMEIEDDEAFLEDLLQNVNLSGNRMQVGQHAHPLDPNAAEFNPGNVDNQQNQNLPPANNVGNAANQINNQIIPVHQMNNQNRQQEGLVNNENGNGNDPGLRDDDADPRDDAEERIANARRDRLRNIIRAAENQASRARQAYVNLFGAGEDGDVREQIRRVMLNQNQNNNNNNHRGNMRGQNNNNNKAMRQNLRQNELDWNDGDNNYDIDNYYHNQIERFFNNNARNQNARYNRGYLNNGNYLNQDYVPGPTRNRRRGRYQGERDAAYWRSRFFQLHNQSKNVKEFFFHDKY
ncbi:uncharacterized protein LOC141528083 isoform X2 [Cotesia typhae]